MLAWISRFVVSCSRPAYRRGLAALQPPCRARRAVVRPPRRARRRVRVSHARPAVSRRSGGPSSSTLAVADELRGVAGRDSAGSADRPARCWRSSRRSATGGRRLIARGERRVRPEALVPGCSARVDGAGVAVIERVPGRRAATATARAGSSRARRASGGPTRSCWRPAWRRRELLRAARRAAADRRREGLQPHVRGGSERAARTRCISRRRRSRSASTTARVRVSGTLELGAQSLTLSATAAGGDHGGGGEALPGWEMPGRPGRLGRVCARCRPTGCRTSAPCPASTALYVATGHGDARDHARAADRRAARDRILIEGRDRLLAAFDPPRGTTTSEQRQEAANEGRIRSDRHPLRLRPYG